MSQTARYQETLRRLAMIDEGFSQKDTEAGLGLALCPHMSTLDPTAIGRAAAAPGYWWPAGRPRSPPWNGAPPGRSRQARRRTRSPMCCWRSPRLTGLGRVVGAAPDVAAALGYDVGAALEDLDDP